MAKTIGQAGIKLIKEFEGCRLTAYKCPAGVWTIGYGHTTGVKSGMKITQAQADKYLIEDCQKFAGYVDNKNYVPFTNQLNSNQRDALISFAFNCGPGSLKTLCAKRSITQVADALLLYNKANGQVLAGLVRRRWAERDLFNKLTEEVHCLFEEPQKYNKKFIKNFTIKDNAPMRVGAGSKKERIVTVKKGSIVRCDGRYSKSGTQTWFLVQYGDYVGYIRKKWLK